MNAPRADAAASLGSNPLYPFDSGGRKAMRGAVRRQACRMPGIGKGVSCVVLGPWVNKARDAPPS